MRMINSFKFGLRWKLNFLIGLILLATMILFEAMSVYHERQLLITERARHFEDLAEHFAWLLQNVTGENPQDLVVNYERDINDNANRDYRALILNAHSQVIAATNQQLIGTVISDQKLLQDAERLSTESPAQLYIRGSSRLLAALPTSVRSGDARAEDTFLTVVISGSLDDLAQSLQASIMTHAVHLLVTALAIAVVTNLALSRFVLRPVQKLLADMARMQRGEWTSEVSVQSNDEVGELTRGYNALGKNLEATVQRLVQAEKLGSVALVAVYLNRWLRKPVEEIRANTRLLCERNSLDAESAHAAGRIFDETEKILAIREKFNRDFSSYCDDISQGKADAADAHTRFMRHIVDDQSSPGLAFTGHIDSGSSGLGASKRITK